jgi:hypothetical protein
MKRLVQATPILLVLAGALLLFQQPAYAYTDPGTGLLAIQAAGSALVAAGWILRRKLQSLFNRASTKKQAQQLPPAQDDKGSSLS